MATTTRPPPKFMPIDEVESLEQYTEGGYHPVRLGDQLGGGRYEILNKLGYGGYSTVWLARDGDLQRLVAVKVTVATPAREDSRELEIRQQLTASAANHPWGKHVQELLNTFVESGPYLHLGNFLVAFPESDVEFVSPEQFREAFPPFTEPIHRWDRAPLTTTSVPPYAVFPRPFCKPTREMTLSDAHLLLTDFGEAWSPAREDRFSLHTPHNYRAPDPLLVGAPLGPAADIWTLAHALYAVYGISDLFQTSYPYPPSRMIVEAISTLGRPPQALWDAWAERSKYFNDAGERCSASKIVRFEEYPLAQCVRDIKTERENLAEEFPNDPPLGDEEIEDLYQMLAAMLQWSPDDRATASQLADGVWMRRWGIPALEQMKERVQRAT
ncbi:kinase-like protein [Auricularia subglabra TFB-10046 SS5]|nr:kinase-like protein [Auricularia subglabra TFB-10046 SS5]